MTDLLSLQDLLSPQEWAALGLSLKVSLWATAASFPFGVLVAWILARTRFWGHGLLNGVVHLPLVLPPVVVGYALLVVLGRNGLVGGWLYTAFGLSFAFTWKGAAIAAGVMAFPLLVRAMRLSLEAVDQDLEQAAQTLGAAPFRVFLTITLPLMLPGLITGCVLGFARALGEFGATITFVSNIPKETQTLPLALYTFTQTPGGEAGTLRLAVLAVIIALGALMISEILARRLKRQNQGSRHDR
ncbi:MAG: molybdate ABC transporter permease subunit [Magnetovibrio sp.]|nr:molybdate ABC transporter permease subunit [Magnetovibrio sp.]